MKTKLLLVLALLIAGTLVTNAQGGGPRHTVEERTKAAMDKLAEFKLDKDKSDQADSVFAQYYRMQDAKRQEMMSGGSPDRDKMRSEMQKMAADRDDKLKKIFTEEQFKKWKDEIEPSLRPQRPGGNGNSGS
ncbi:MAG: hypothetical protein JWM28_3787 [Chitinophagaceae bacterium]|nr:hypothetical protein [Chitinophagaceae bacterium]